MDWPHDDTASLIGFYGDPRGPGWVTANLVAFSPPWAMSYRDDDGKVSPVHHFEVHRKIITPLTSIFACIWEHYGKSQAAIEAVGMQWYGGCFNFRPVRGSARLSCHAFGAAIDLDPEQNPMNRSHLSHMAPAVVDAFKREGAFWGGDFKSRQDPMHFQFAHE